MHSTLSRLALLGWLLSLAWWAGPAQALEEGFDYQLLTQPQPTETGDKVEVLELFWYGCPHCYHLEPGISRWLAHKPAQAAFRRMPAILGPSWEPHARAYYAMEVMGVLDRLHPKLFEAIHRERKRLFTKAALADWVASQGVDRDAFLSAYDSFEVDMKVRKAKLMSRRYGIDGVPSVIVAGRYRTSPTLTAGSEKMFSVIDALVAREAAKDEGDAKP